MSYLDGVNGRARVVLGLDWGAQVPARTGPRDQPHPTVTAALKGRSPLLRGGIEEAPGEVRAALRDDLLHDLGLRLLALLRQVHGLVAMELTRRTFRSQISVKQQ
jgi:hypothetical protein